MLDRTNPPIPVLVAACVALALVCAPPSGGAQPITPAVPPDIATTSAAHGSAGSDRHPEPRLSTQRGDGFARVEGEHFAFEWSAAASGDLSTIELHDGVEWHSIMGSTKVRESVPGIRLVTSAGDLAPRGPATIEWLEDTPDVARIRSTTRLADREGTPGPITLEQVFTVYPEGALFVGFTLELPPGSPPIELERASLGLPTELDAFDLQRTHWRSSVQAGRRFAEPKDDFRHVGCANGGVALGFDTEFTNQLQISLEHQQLLGGEAAKKVPFGLSTDLYFVYNLRPKSAGTVTLTAPYRYTNRLALFLGRQRGRDPLLASRVVYWREGGESLMAFPSYNALAAMVDCGANVVVLGPGWRQAAGRHGHVPTDEPAFRQMIDDAHSLGIRVVVTVTAGGDPLEIAAWANQAELDGLLVEKVSAHFGLIPDAGSSFPAHATFRWCRDLRRALGPDALVIGHSGVDGPDLSAGLALPGVAFGLDRNHRDAWTNRVLAAYLGGQGYGVQCPITVHHLSRRTQAMAAYASNGAVPLVAAGKAAQRSAYRACKWVLPLWQIYRLAPPGTHNASVRRDLVVRREAPRFYGRLYQSSPDLCLLVSANFGNAPVDSTSFYLEFPELDMDGSYDVYEARSFGNEHETIYLGRTVDGTLITEPVGRFGIRGFLLARGDVPPELALELDRIAILTRAFNDVSAPRPTHPVEVDVEPGVMRLSWQPAADNHHVDAYRVIRSPTPELDYETYDEIAIVYEQTSHLDVGVAPGEQVYYSVMPIDLMGNEGFASAVTAARQPGGDQVWTFDDPQALDDIEVQSGLWSIDDGALCRGCTPDAERFAVGFLRGVEVADFDLRAMIGDPLPYRFAGGFFFRVNDAGDGYVVALDHPDAKWVRLSIREGERSRVLAETYHPYAEHSSGDRTLRALRLVCRGPEMIVYLDGKEVLRASDDTLEGQRLGFVAHQGRVHFDHVVINAAPDSNP